MRNLEPATAGYSFPPYVFYGGLALFGLFTLYLPGLLLPLLGLEDFAQRSTFLALGMAGAIFANSTGAGGGVVFIPAFHHLGFTEAQAVATSFGIQCFGMTTGAIAWSLYFRREHLLAVSWQPLFPVLALSSLCAISGLWTVYAFNIVAPAAVNPLFGSFSLLLGALVLITALRRSNGVARKSLAGRDIAALPVIAYLGGIVTAWLSVGAGEFLAFYLILRGYDATKSVAVAVIVSAILVWSAAPQQLLLNQQANWQVLLVSGPAAIAGGLAARHLVLRLGAKRLKLFFGSWLFLIGLSEFLPLS